MADYLLGIDYGTGGAKACIINGAADVLAYAFREYPILLEKPGWSEHKVELYWEIACQLVQQCVEDAKIDPREVRCIGTSSALPCLVMVDRDLNPIHNAYNLMDRRAVAEVQWLQETIGGREIFEISGNRLEDHPSIVNLLWEKNNRPESFKRIYKALTIDGFIRLRLTGKCTVNYSNAAFYGVAFNIRQNRFEEAILERIGIPIEMMPDIYPCEAIVGEVLPEAAVLMGLVPGIPVVAGQADCNAGWVGAGAIEEGDTQMNLGTCGNFGVIHKDDHFIDSMIVCAYTVDSSHTYITIPTTTTGGQCLRFLRDGFSQIETAMEELTGINPYDLLNKEAERVPPGSEGLVVLPYLMGERTPIWDSDARSVIFGLSLNHNKAHVVRAMMESVAYALYDSFCIIRESGKKIKEPIILNEGGAISTVWRRIITDVFDVPTVLVKNRVGAPYGDAILAGVGVGVFSDYNIAKHRAEYVEPMEPIRGNHDIYMELFKIYKDLYSHVAGDFKALAAFRGRA